MVYDTRMCVCTCRCVCVPSIRARVPVSAPVAAGYGDSDVARHRRGLCVCVWYSDGFWHPRAGSTGPGLVARKAIRTLISTCHSEQL